MISVLIPAKNEELNLPDCLNSVRWCDDVHVFDSGSTDQTAEVARSAGALVTRRSNETHQGIFGGDEAAHKNWALRNIPFRHKWILHIDADERVTPGLRDSLLRAVTAPNEIVAFEVQRRDFFLGQWLKHVQATPFYLRFFHREHMRYERLINPVSIPDGPVGRLQGYLDHYPFNKGLEYWLERHNAYSTLEARQIQKNRSNQGPFSWRSALFAKHMAERRHHQKELFYRMPVRPFFKFGLLYFAKRGFLDGKAGLTYAALQAFYEYMIVLKTREFDIQHATASPHSECGATVAPL